MKGSTLKNGCLRRCGVTEGKEGTEWVRWGAGLKGRVVKGAWRGISKTNLLLQKLTWTRLKWSYLSWVTVPPVRHHRLANITLSATSQWLLEQLILLII